MAEASRISSPAAAGVRACGRFKHQQLSRISSYFRFFLRSRVRPESARLFEKSASQSHHGVVSRGGSGAREAAAAGGPMAAKAPGASPPSWSPNQGSHEVLLSASVQSEREG